MKFVKKAAVLATAVIAVQYLPGFVRDHHVDAVTNNNQSEIVDALITGYEIDPEDPANYRVITSDTVSNATPNASGLVHNSKFSDCVQLDGIDVSKYQGNVNWNSVAADGVDFAVTRVGYRGYDGGKIVVDSTCSANLKNATAAGLDVGVYFFSQAINTQEAIEEANTCLNAVRGYNITLPIYIDVESTTSSGRLDRANLTIAQRTAIVEAFCQTVENAGYEAGIYANKSYFLNYLDPDYLSTKYKIWLAHYVTQSNYKGDYQIWQYSDRGTVKGVSGYVDRDVMYSKKVNFTKDSITIDDPAVSIKPDVSGDGVLTFESSDPSVATVDAAGNIAGISSGTAIITVFSNNGSRDTLTVNVDLPPLTVLTYSGMLFSQIGASEVISRSGVQLTSSDASVVAVAEDGTAVAKGCGTASITADDGQGNTAVCTVLVTDSEPLPGDCNLDGLVNAVDAVYILNLAAALGTNNESNQFSESYMNLYDFNADGKVDAFDASDVLISSACAGAGYRK